MGALLLAAGCASRVPPVPPDPNVGYASWYGPKFHGRKTASGEVYDMHAFTAAHRTAEFGTRVRVTNLGNDRSTIVRINDRGPFVRGRIIDLSYAAARDIGVVAPGTAKVRLEVLGETKTKAPEPTPEPAPSPDRDWFVQVAAFGESGNAERFLEELLATVPLEGGSVRPAGRLHRVWFGPYEDEKAAHEVLVRLKSAGYEGFVLRR